MWYQNLASTTKKPRLSYSKAKSVCNTAPTACSFSFQPKINDWEIRILESQYQRKKTPMLKYINTLEPSESLGQDQIL